MRSRILPLLAVLAMVPLASACDEDSKAPLTAPAPQAPASGTLAYLTVSDPRPAAGSLVTITAVARDGADLAKVGAFSASLVYDAAGLTYAGESALPGMRAVNAKHGEILAAGASNDGFTDGQLFAVTFKVVDPAALASLRLSFRELAGTDFGNHLARLDLRQQVYSSRR